MKRRSFITAVGTAVAAIPVLSKLKSDPVSPEPIRPFDENGRRFAFLRAGHAIKVGEIVMFNGTELIPWEQDARWPLAIALNGGVRGELIRVQVNGAVSLLCSTV